jgi:syntaxin 7
MQLENETVFNEAVIEEREQGIRDIHQQIGEVNELFKDLAVLVHEQGYMIGSYDIDKNIVGAEAATEEASQQLVKADKSQKSGSNIASLILVIVVMVLLIRIILLKIL